MIELTINIDETKIKRWGAIYIDSFVINKGIMNFGKILTPGYEFINIEKSPALSFKIQSSDKNKKSNLTLDSNNIKKNNKKIIKKIKKTIT
jgi:hypothetical protein